MKEYLHVITEDPTTDLSLYAKRRWVVKSFIRHYTAQSPDGFAEVNKYVYLMERDALLDSP